MAVLSSARVSTQRIIGEKRQPTWHAFRRQQPLSEEVRLASARAPSERSRASILAGLPGAPGCCVVHAEATDAPTHKPLASASKPSRSALPSPGWPRKVQLQALHLTSLREAQKQQPCEGEDDEPYEHGDGMAVPLLTARATYKQLLGRAGPQGPALPLSAQPPPPPTPLADASTRPGQRARVALDMGAGPQPNSHSPASSVHSLPRSLGHTAASTACTRDTPSSHSAPEHLPQLGKEWGAAPRARPIATPPCAEEEAPSSSRQHTTAGSRSALPTSSRSSSLRSASTIARAYPGSAGSTSSTSHTSQLATTSATTSTPLSAGTTRAPAPATMTVAPTSTVLAPLPKSIGPVLSPPAAASSSSRDGVISGTPSLDNEVGRQSDTAAAQESWSLFGPAVADEREMGFRVRAAAVLVTVLQWMVRHTLTRRRPPAAEAGRVPAQQRQMWVALALSLLGCANVA